MFEKLGDNCTVSGFPMSVVPMKGQVDLQQWQIVNYCIGRQLVSEIISACLILTKMAIVNLGGSGNFFN